MTQTTQKHNNHLRFEQLTGQHRLLLRNSRFQSWKGGSVRLQGSSRSLPFQSQVGLLHSALHPAAQTPGLQSLTFDLALPLARFRQATRSPQPPVRVTMAMTELKMSIHKCNCELQCIDSLVKRGGEGLKVKCFTNALFC